MTWSTIHRQAREIRRRKTRKGQQAHAARYFAMVRDALQVRDVQPDPSTDVDAGASPDLSGQVAADLIARCKT